MALNSEAVGGGDEHCCKVLQFSAILTMGAASENIDINVIVPANHCRLSREEI